MAGRALSALRADNDGFALGAVAHREVRFVVDSQRVADLVSVGLNVAIFGLEVLRHELDDLLIVGGVVCSILQAQEVALLVLLGITSGLLQVGAASILVFMVF